MYNRVIYNLLLINLPGIAERAASERAVGLFALSRPDQQEKAGGPVGKEGLPGGTAYLWSHEHYQSSPVSTLEHLFPSPNLIKESV